MNQHVRDNSPQLSRAIMENNFLSVNSRLIWSILLIS